jgi:YebC/PmpR family DNA-binding regulatory protein
MAGHSHWKQIKVQKGTTDKKRAVVFSKLLKAVTIASKGEPNPQFNPRLRTMIEKARESNVPQENIERAINRASLKNEDLEEVILEAYGPGGTGILIEGITDNKNRTMQEIKLILKENDAHLAEPGAVRWAFQKESVGTEWIPKFKSTLDNETRNKVIKLVSLLENQDDVQGVYQNSQ